MKYWLLLLLSLPLLACAVTNRVEDEMMPTATAPATDSDPVDFYLVLKEDTGQNGIPVGCDDSVVAVAGSQVNSGNVAQDVENALGELLALRVTDVQGGYYNALGNQSLGVEDVTLQDRDLVLNLSGQLQLTGVCEDARLQYQLLYTVFQYEGFDRAFIYLNGRSLKQAFDASGTAGETSPFLRSELPAAP